MKLIAESLGETLLKSCENAMEWMEKNTMAKTAGFFIVGVDFRLQDNTIKRNGTLKTTKNSRKLLFNRMPSNEDFEEKKSVEGSGILPSTLKRN